MPAPSLESRFVVRLADALCAVMSEADWKRFATLYGLERRIVGHSRFLRSLSWSDPDYSGHVLDLVRELRDDDDNAAFEELVGLPEVQRWFTQNAPDLLSSWQGPPDPLLGAISHSLEEVEATEKSGRLEPAHKRYSISTTRQSSAGDRSDQGAFRIRDEDHS